MSQNFEIGIFCGLVAAVIGCWLLSDFIVYVYHEGYKAGRRDAADWWTQTAKDLDQMQVRERNEQRWP